MKGKLYNVGVLLMFVGGAGLAQIQMDSNGCFWLFAIMFGVGVGCCLGGYGHE